MGNKVWSVGNTDAGEMITAASTDTLIYTPPTGKVFEPELFIFAPTVALTIAQKISFWDLTASTGDPMFAIFIPTTATEQTYILTEEQMVGMRFKNAVCIQGTATGHVYIAGEIQG